MEDLVARGTPFSAVLAANDRMAAGAAKALHGLGLRVPEDVSIVGFDDLLTSAHAIPPRTTVSWHVVELGRRAAEAMLDLLAGRPPVARAPEPQLVVRQSTRPPRARLERSLKAPAEASSRSAARPGR
jgi:LacI family transcriptional regulator